MGAPAILECAKPARRLTSSDRELLAEHVLRLFDLADTHREFAATRADRSGCVQTPATALVAARKTERLATLISELVGEKAERWPGPIEKDLIKRLTPKP